MSKVKAGNIKKGTYIEYRNQPHHVLKTQFVSPGKGSAFTRTKMRSMVTGAVIEFNFKSHDSIEELDIESKEMQFLYVDGDDVIFMDKQTYEQVNVPIELLNSGSSYLVPELMAYVTFYQGKSLGVNLPPKVKIVVKEAEEAVAGDRQNAGKKSVIMETGLVVQAPLFVKKGDILIIDTDSGNYVSRAN